MVIAQGEVWWADLATLGPSLFDAELRIAVPNDTSRAAWREESSQFDGHPAPGTIEHAGT